ncbi:hypothetical protein HOB10_01695 [Candidatus Parcubacteria bacterium]|jgi:hypothetical protein|nr:hypothetical protein [Candidatus Parcubacteria bacterium]
MGFEDRNKESLPVAGVVEKTEKEASISPEILKSASDFQKVFNEHGKKVWLMGSLSIAAHLGEPHRDITNDIDYFTTTDDIDEVILDLEDRGFIVEEGWGNKFRATNPETGIRADVAMLDINSETGNYEVADWSFPASGFPEDEKEIGGINVRPISLEMLATMKKKAAEDSGGKHILDYQVLEAEMSQLGLDASEFAKQTKFDGLDIIDKSDLTGDDWEYLIEKKWAKYGELKDQLVELHERAGDDSYEYPEFLVAIFPANVLERIKNKASEVDIEKFRVYIASKFATYFKEKFEDDAYGEVK